MSATQLNLWELLEDLVSAPPTTSIDPMWIEFDRLIKEVQSQSLADQLELVGKAILGCSEVVAARANNTIQVLDDRQKCGVTVKADLFGLLIRQPIGQAWLDEVIESPEQEFSQHPSYKRSVAPIITEIPIDEALKYVEPEIATIESIKKLAGSDDPSAWIQIVDAALISGATTLSQVVAQTELTQAEAWMACLLGGFELSQLEWWGDVSINQLIN